jgi:hypothetical protein
VTGETIDVDISGLTIRFERLTSSLAEDLRREWPAYLRAAGGAPALSVRVLDDDRAMTPGRFMEGTLRIEPSEDGVTVRGAEGDLLQRSSGLTAVARLAQGDRGRRFWGLVNLTLAAISMRLQRRGGGVLHAAGAIVDGRAFLLVGPSGCGKTTWAKTAADAGLPVLSDDCVLVDAVGEGLVALGSPFRAKDFPSPGPGRWPVAALLVPSWADAPALQPVARLMLEARVASNLLFASTAWDAHSDGVSAAGSLSARAPAWTLRFRPDGSWVPVVAALRG